VSAYSGMPEVVRALHERGIKLGIVTSKRHEGAVRGLRSMGLEDVFPVVLGVDDVERPKPNPEPVLQALQMLGADAETTVFVGDSTHDMECGRAAGVRTAAVLWGPFSRASLEPHEPTWWVEHPDAFMTTLGL
jgi:pyrophosphatase PpaX